MITILYIFAKTVALLLSAISFAMLVRVILPLFVTEPESNKLYVFVFVLTELFLKLLKNSTKVQTFHISELLSC